jgi:hypothetical protein
MSAATMRRIDALLQERQRVWAAGGDRAVAERLERDLAKLYDERRRARAGRTGAPYRGATMRWPG